VAAGTPTARQATARPEAIAIRLYLMKVLPTG
jgi:hypothetical protein